MKETAPKTDPPFSSITAIAVIAFLWLLHFLPFLMPQARMWGFNHLLFLSPVYLYIYLVGGVVALMMFFPPVRNIGQRWYDAVAVLFFERRNRARWIIVSIASLVVFWFGRIPIYLLGDSYSIIENISNDLPVIFKWSEIGAIYLAYFVAKLLPTSGSQLGEYAYGIIAVVSGAVTVYLFFALAWELGKDAVSRLFIFCLSLFAGWIVLFLGYAENYPVLWPFITGYIYFSVRYINKRSSLIWPTIMLALALILHLQVLFFLISYPVLLIARGKPAHLFYSHKKTVLSLAAVIVIAAAIGFFQMYRHSLELQMYLMPLWEGWPATPYYSLFSPAHLLDIASQLLLVVPLLPALIVLGWKGWRSLFDDKINAFLFTFSLGGVVFLFIIDPKLGLARDWDLFALSGLAPMILLAKNATGKGLFSYKIFPALVLMSLLMVMPFVATNLTRQAAIDNYKYLLNLDLPKSRTGLTILRQMASDAGDTLQSDSIKNVLIKALPAIEQVSRAYQLMDLGKLAEAMILVDSIARVHPTTVETYNLRGSVYLKMGRYAQAIKDLEMAAKLGRYDARPLASLAMAYHHLGRMDRMMEALEKGRKRDPNSSEIIDGFMTGFYSMKRYDSAYYYGEKMISLLPSYPKAYWVAGYSAMQIGDKVRAKTYITHFIEMTPDENNRKIAQEILKQLE